MLKLVMDMALLGHCRNALISMIKFLSVYIYVLNIIVVELCTVNLI